MSDPTLITAISIGVTFLFMLGVPVFLVIGYWVIGVSFVLGMPLQNIGGALGDVFTDGFALLAMPLFILTGDLINRSGIARRLSDFAYACLGWIRGGLAMAALGACGLFAAISGSNSATTATIGSMLHPEMIKGGYDARFSAATAAAGGTVGIIIPPSIIFIVYGFLLNLPISELFVAGIIPGALMVLAMMFAAFLICWRNGWGFLIPLSPLRVFKTAIGAWLGFFAIGLVLWGIYTGKFSPTEAAGVTVGFCVIVGFISLPLYKLMGGAKGRDVSEKKISEMLVVEGFSPLELPSITMRSAQITGILAPLIAVSVVMQQILSVLGAQEVIGNFVTSMGGYYAVLFTAMAIVFVCGMVLESLPVTIILAPILAPIAHSVGVEPVQFAVIFLVGASIGFVTPPYGLNLYVASGVTGVPYFKLLRYIVPYLVALLSVWVLVALVPSLSTALLPQR
ncbi:putative TRAP dicarboxylate transporter, DctM subunit [Roseovarius sp. EC-HK134]|jgi:TRAP-type C4-dicarboxylate transport system permease large subunit|uniref:C4-dicarboxylate TRAP transporter large permease protein DctM n=1 Tax=Roseovarius mucosus TaxID=215743 RepID=A0A1V0RQQ4_9RHOB|nr:MULTISPECIES: TRAP transporter large permease [Roseovarius]ARE84061.1 C4-dicarboxylate TRAP transporter large permease protein DctM [Roseovarius mucosus]AWZ19294.1 TRAP-type C4-dicarboxylate transport system, large permease component [Roseovarius sp. AK1035]EDM33472.1 TRAP dicarboxylate transporter, DctM subunit, putative [Roseovarius sp. TM1035]VVT03644.1 putative TRAP dicarboxylate transporter, DctM subunit [Roseovarius sp. EC-HK134]VVT04041.1 putative TRAP dicarboxylate transporter, DctM|tara:strand:+ start:2018 stop:3376 length:1359 start_codon:yes stop_codon:yes gene_type:complete